MNHTAETTYYHKPHGGGQGNIVLTAAMLVLAFVFVGMFAITSSPLTPGMAYDYSVYYGMADVWAKGHTPYVDMFDNKGPILYLIDMLAIKIAGGKVGIYIVESLFLFWSLMLMRRIGHRMRMSGLRIAIAICVTLLAMAYFIECGNTNEEYSLPLVLYPLWVGIGYFSRRRLPAAGVILSGVCLALVAFIRLNNAAIICGVALAVAVRMISHRHYGRLAAKAALSLAGAIATTMAILAWFLNMGALEEMLYATFTYNFEYLVRRAEPDYAYNLLMLAWCVVLPIIVYWSGDKQRRRYFMPMTVVSAVTLATFIASAGYPHYFIMTLPLVYLCCLFLGFYRRTIALAAGAVLVLPYIYFTGKAAVSNLQFKAPRAYAALPTVLQRGYPYAALAIDYRAFNDSILSRIPRDARKSVYTFGDLTLSSLFVGSPEIAVGRYTGQQPMAGSIRAVPREMLIQFKKAAPRYVVTSDTAAFIEIMRPTGYTLTDSVRLTPVNRYYIYKR